MLKMLIRLLVISLLVSSCATANTKVDDKIPTSTPCEESLKQCDIVVEKKNKVIQEQDKLIKDYEGALNDSNTALERSKEAIKKPYRNPLLMGAVGATAGMLLGGPIVIAVGFIGGLLL